MLTHIDYTMNMVKKRKSKLFL